MATSDNYLRRIKCWLKLHSNLKEGNETEDAQSDKASVSAGCHQHSPQGPVLGLQAAASMLQPSCLPGFGGSRSSVT